MGMLTGTYTAIVTPFRNGKFDAAALRRLIGRQIEAGIDGIVPVGTTGESPTLNYQEHIEVIARSVEFAAGKIKVMAGTGGNSTSEAVYLTAEAEKAGADSTLQVAPYYNRPTQEGLYQHFLEICRARQIARDSLQRSFALRGRDCGRDGAPAGGSHAPRGGDQGIGRQSGSGEPIARRPRQPVLHLLRRRFHDAAFHGVGRARGGQRGVKHYSTASGANGAGLRRGDFAAALKLQDRYYPIFKDLFIESNPVPVKAAAAMLGQIEEEYRLPLVPLSAKNRAILKATLVQCGILKP